MPEELGTRDVLQQVDARLGSLEQNAGQTRSEIVGLRSEMNARFDGVHQDFTKLGDTLRSESAANSRWQIGLMVTVWLSLMATIWLRT